MTAIVDLFSTSLLVVWADADVEMKDNDFVVNKIDISSVMGNIRLGLSMLKWLDGVKSAKLCYNCQFETFFSWLGVHKATIRN